MIERYTLPEMGELWTEIYKKTMWHEVELAALFAKEELGFAPKGVFESARAIKITEDVLKRADEIELTGDHDYNAFILAVTERLEELVAIHYHIGMTTFDGEDTALAIILHDCLKLLLKKLKSLSAVLLRRANEHRRTMEIGRTHFIHAEPITFGFKLLGWVDVVERHIKRLLYVKDEINIGKFSGAVGFYTLPPEVEEIACEYLGLKPARISTQIISRDILGHYAATLAAIANSLDRFATEIRHLAGTDISEVAEFKRPGATGSSAMPGKSMLRNPIKSENTCGLARVARGYLIPAFECEVVWGERTLENSAAERIYLPDLTIGLDFMLQRFSDVMDKLEVFPEQMERNIWRTGGIVFAQKIMLKLTEKGITRKEAYTILEATALLVNRGTFTTKEGKNFQDLIFDNEYINSLLTKSELNECFDPKTSLKYVDKIFARFGL